MQKILIFPYDDELNPILKYKELLTEYQISKVVSLKGWGYCGKDAGVTNNRGSLGFTVTNDFDNNLDQCDAVLFCETKIPVDFEKVIMPRVNLASERGKNIIFSSKLNEVDFEKVTKKCNECNVEFKYFYNNRSKSYYDLNEFYEPIYDILTPVIFVVGMSQRTNKFDLQLSLRKHITERGYKVSQVGSRNYCELLGFHSFPAFMYSSQSESNKIVMFNRYIKEIEHKEAPDVIIIGIPGGIVPINNQFTNHFGIFAYEISQAITPDVSLFSTLYDEYMNEYFEILSTSIKHKFGFDVDCFNLSNNIFEWNDSDFCKKEMYISINSKLVDEKLQEYSRLGTVIGNSLNDESAKKMADLLINKLAGYAETECV